MRATETNDGLRVHAVAGTYVVLLGFDLPEADCDGLLGFSIHRSDETENEAGFLSGMKAFRRPIPASRRAPSTRPRTTRSRASSGRTTPRSPGTTTPTR